MKIRLKKKAAGIVAFIAVCLVVCYLFDMTSLRYNNTETYGEYNKRTNHAADEEQVQEAMKSETKQSVVKKHVEQENTTQKKSEDSQEKVKKQLTKKVFLTFDDGPSENTEKVLETLKKYNARATFFMIGEQITPEKEELVKSMVKAGHMVGVHTYTHNEKKMYANKEACLKDIKKTYDRILEVTGVKPIYYRFPYGSANCYVSGYCNEVIRELKGMGLEYIDWNVTGEDSVGKPTSYSIMKNVSKFKNYMEPVVLLHDGQSNKLTAKLLPQILKKMKAAGYEFGTMDERSELYQWPHDWQKK